MESKHERITYSITNGLTVFINREGGYDEVVDVTISYADNKIIIRGMEEYIERREVLEVDDETSSILTKKWENSTIAYKWGFLPYVKTTISGYIDVKKYKSITITSNNYIIIR